ncbi:hypothetical protein, partial [Curtobacterium sp. MCPF17_047]|uniref:hypothetical protein n=2 Tax=unclassified Curtobacterium TaxID=257496 RepID=UPI001C65146B
PSPCPRLSIPHTPMPHLLNALTSVLVVAGLLASQSLRPGLGLLLSLAGSVIANQLVWIISPTAWSHLVTPWLASASGTLVAVALWSVLRTSPRVLDLLGATATGSD